MLQSVMDRKFKNNIDKIVELAELRASVKQLPVSVYEFLVENKEDVFEGIETYYGKTKRKEVEKWYEKYDYELPKIFDEKFSYNILGAVFGAFMRFFLDNALREKEYRKRYTNILTEFMIYTDVFYRSDIRGWIRRDPTLPQRFMTFSSLFKNSKMHNNVFLAFFYYYILDTPLVERGKSSKMQKEFVTNVINTIGFGRVINPNDSIFPLLHEEMTSVLEEYINWILEKFKGFAIPYPDRDNIQVIKLFRRKRTIFSSYLVRFRWITKKFAKELKLTEDMTDEALFPNLHNYLLEKDPQFITSSEEKILAAIRK